MINLPRGTKDLLPADSHKWQHIERCAMMAAARFGYRYIRTPVFEHTELFLRGIGEGTDVVNKEMYTFCDKGDRSMTLKPEGTAGVARAYIEHSLAGEGLPARLFYLTPVFRYETPQAGRLREHHQFGAEIYGSDSYLAEAEVIIFAHDFLHNLGLTGVTLQLNSIGCTLCRPSYNDALRGFIEAHSASFCPTCRQRAVTNTLRVLDCKHPQCRQMLATAPQIGDYICDKCANNMTALTTLLTQMDIPFVTNPRIVRGLDYYNGTVFEFVTDHLGSQGTICAGGRYDRLVSDLGGAPTPCVGFGLGIERLMMLLEAQGREIGRPDPVDIYVVHIGADQREYAFGLAQSVRRSGFCAVYDVMGRSLKAQMRHADKLSARFVIVIGSDEQATGTAKLRRMSDGLEQSVQLARLAEYL